MEVKIDTKLFREAIAQTVSVIDKRSSRPILTNCFIEVNNDFLCVQATDLDISLKIIIPVIHNGSGSFCISTKNISEILRELPAGDLEISLENNLLNLKCGNSKFSLLVSSTEDYPELSFSDSKSENTFELTGKELNELIQRTSFAMSTDETRSFLNGIYIHSIGENRIRSVAIDGHRLALLDKNIKQNSSFLDGGVIIPRKGVLELKKIGEKAGSDKLTLSVQNSFLNVKYSEEYFLLVRLISRDYPNYKTVIPNKVNFKATGNRQNILNSVKRIKILSNENTNGVRFKFLENKLQLTAHNDSLGKAQETLEIEYSNDEVEVSLNARYVMEALTSLECENIVIEINNSLSPVVIKDSMSDDFLGIIMPLRI
jgi:DNA polymerase-3 subunit beta